jgi:hypothetical protein
MPSPPIEEPVSRPAGIVERLVRDDVDRKRFLKMAGATGAASFGAFVLAACGARRGGVPRSGGQHPERLPADMPMVLAAVKPFLG